MKNLFSNLVEFINQNPLVFYSAIVVLVLLVVMIVILVCVNANKKRRKEEQPQIEETDVVVESVTEENEEVTEEGVVEEKGQKEEVLEETKPVLEESTPKEVLEETKPKKRVKKEKSVEGQVEETKVVEEEVEMAEKKPVKKEVVVEEKKQRVVNGKYEVYTDGTSYFYTLKASNGEVLIKSEAYASKNSVLEAIEAIKRNVEVGTIAVREDKHGLYQFVLTYIFCNLKSMYLSFFYQLDNILQLLKKWYLILVFQLYRKVFVKLHH